MTEQERIQNRVEAALDTMQQVGLTIAQIREIVAAIAVMTIFEAREAFKEN